MTENEQKLFDTIKDMAGDWSGTPYVMDVLDQSGLSNKVGRAIITSLQNKGLVKVQPEFNEPTHCYVEPAYCWIVGDEEA